MQLLFSLVHSTEAPVSSEVKKMSQSSKIGFLKYKAFLDAYSKANPELTRPTQIENAQELWKNVKNDPEKHSQMMLEFRTKSRCNRNIMFPLVFIYFEIPLHSW